MVEPVSTGAIILGGSIGGGAWLADKLLGPSASALGDHLRLYAGARLSKILKRAEDKVQGEEVKSLPPGFAYLAFQKASFAEDDEALTEMWANLLINASASFSGRHTLFADILSQITGLDAKTLDDLCPETVRFSMDDRVLPETVFGRLVGSSDSALDDKARIVEIAKSWSGGHGMRIASVSVRNVRVDGPVPTYTTQVRLDEVSFSVLERQSLVRRFTASSSNNYVHADVRGYQVSALGLEFLSTCRIIK
jgi:hypothetical protein